MNRGLAAVLSDHEADAVALARSSGMKSPDLQVLARNKQQKTRPLHFSSQIAKRYTLSGAYGLVNDVLIALSARSIGATVITQNERDFV